MRTDRRQFIRQVTGVAAAGAGLCSMCKANASSGEHKDYSQSKAVLVDLGMCIGCRLCEYACRDSNGIETGPLSSYDDTSVFKDKRGLEPDRFTVINEYKPADYPQPVYAKSNCMHCNHPACVSACIVGALTKQDNGAVTYDAWKCIGCRYCMVACPFQVPSYDYDDAFTPEVRKCTLCNQHKDGNGTPACVAACPREAMVCGTRGELLELAHERIAKHPDKYVNHVYGEHEVGGTSWMYLSPVPFEEVGFKTLSEDAPPELTESIQHGVFKYGLPPLALYGLLGLVMFTTRRKADSAIEEEIEALERDRKARESIRTEVHDPADRVSDRSTGERLVDRVVENEAIEPAIDEPPVIATEESHAEHHKPEPVAQPFFTPGVWVLVAIALVGAAGMLYRFIYGLQAATNLDHSYPWGLWIAVDVATGVALAAGGFTSGALAHVFNREHYHAIVRPALLTAMLGYTFVVIGLQADLGRYYNVWHPMFMWQGNSVLFEVGICVMCYLNVLYLEFAPIVCERVESMENRPRLARLAGWVRVRLEKVMFLLIIAGCVLSCLHQSSLGNLMVIAPTKLHALWWTPISPLLFLMSAIAVGFPMIIFESLLASRSFKFKPELDVLEPLARYVPVFLGLYLAFKIGDMVVRGTWVYLGDGSLESIAWLVEVGLGVVLPMLMLLTAKVRRSPMLLFIAAALVVLGVALNRINVFLIGYTPPDAQGAYVPSFTEIAVTVGLIATLVLVYRACVLYLPVISQPAQSGAASDA